MNRKVIIIFNLFLLYSNMKIILTINIILYFNNYVIIIIILYNTMLFHKNIISLNFLIKFLIKEFFQL